MKSYSTMINEGKTKKDNLKRPVNNPDESLILKISKGDKEAFAELYSLTNMAVYGFALSITRNKHDAEEVMQDTYLKIYSSADRYDPQGKPMAWILTIAGNLALTKLNYRKREKPVPEDDWSVPDPENGYERATDKIVLDTAMKVLTDQERQIVVLHGVVGFKHREISGLLKIPLATVITKYRRSLSKLKKSLREDGKNER